MKENNRRPQIFKHSLIIAVLSITIGFSAEAQTPYLINEFGVSDDVELEVRTSGGSIEVIGSKTDAVKVEMYVKKRGDYLTREDTDLSDYEIDIRKDGDRIIAIAKKEDRRGWRSDGYNISFKVYAPVQTQTSLRTSGGSIDVENLMGQQNARTSGGSIRAIGIGGNVDLRTSGGSITLENIEGRVEANTSGGRIRAESVTGGIDVRTSGGSITLAKISGNVEAKTSGGSIDAEVVNPGEYVELRTSGGSISITVPEDRGYDLELDGNRVRADLKNFSGEYERDEIEGKMNGGGIRVKARTSGGSVNLRYL